MKFSKPWVQLLPPDSQVNPFVPAIQVYLEDSNGGLQHEYFVIDSGADISMASRQLCETLGHPWESGDSMTLHGISPRPECAVVARVHEVEILLPEISGMLRIPVCFADGDAPQLLGRDGFFDFFRITFDKWTLETIFEFADEETE